MVPDAPPRSIALVLLSAIGDVVHGLPVVASLRRAWPEASITWVVQPAAHGLIAGHPDVSEIVVFERDRGLRAFAEIRRFAATRRFDLVLALQVYFKAGLITWLLRSPRKLGFDRRRARDLNWLFTNERIPPRPPQHVQDQYFEFLEHLDVPLVREWNFFFREAELRAQREFFERLERPGLAVVLRTTREDKNWLPERYARVLEAADSDLGLQPILVGGAAREEMAAAAEVSRLTRARVVDARKNDLRRLAWLLGGSAIALSPDTGPLHMAVALGTPTVGLYGATDPKRVGPYRRFADLLIDRYTRPGETTPSMEFRAGNMQRIEVAHVLEKLELAVRTYL